MDSNSNTQKKKKIAITPITFKEQQPDPVEKISENGSLILPQFRLNSQGITIKHENNSFNFSLARDLSLNLSLDSLVSLGKLGEGASGQVEKVQHEPSGTIYAMKVIQSFFFSIKKKISVSFDEIHLKQLSDELKLALECDSPYVVKCFGAFYKQGFLHIVLEYMDAGSIYSLMKKVRKLNEPLCAILTHQVLKGLDYLHNKKKIIHRDIKPQNILVNTKGEIKITDFGISSTIETLQQRQTFIGTAIYMSPERLNGEPYRFDSDIWSVGMMIIECLLGDHPIQQNYYNIMKRPKEGFITTVDQIQSFSIESKEYSSISKEMKQFIGAWYYIIKNIISIKKVPSDRATTTDLLQSKIIKRVEKVDKSVFLDWLKYVTQN